MTERWKLTKDDIATIHIGGKMSPDPKDTPDSPPTPPTTPASSVVKSPVDPTPPTARELKLVDLNRTAQSLTDSELDSVLQYAKGQPSKKV